MCKADAFFRDCVSAKCIGNCILRDCDLCFVAKCFGGRGGGESVNFNLDKKINKIVSRWSSLMVTHDVL